MASETLAPILLGFILPLYALTLIVYTLRIYTRLTPKYALTLPDWMISIAFLAKTASIGFMMAAIHHGFGKHTSDISDAKRLTLNSNPLGVFMTGVATSGFARISIATLLLRFTTKRTWRVIIYIIIALQATAVAVYLIVQLVQCRTVIAGREHFRETQCLKKTQVWAFSYVNVALCMVSDCICTALPILLVWRLSRSRVEKGLVVVLIASCLVATACGIPKIYYLVVYDFATKDPLWDLVPEFFWCRLEEGIIIIAACAPLLKGPIERWFRGLGCAALERQPRTLNRITTGGFGTREWVEGQVPWSLPSEAETVVGAGTEGGTKTDEKKDIEANA
ncbi:hypothetical protein OQA88_660 [Cercophora sp. LCS_1]